MIAEYDGYAYKVIMHEKEALLITANKEKAVDGFESGRFGFEKFVSLDDELLDSIYDVFYLVKYKDQAEGEFDWYIDEGQSTGLISKVEDGEVTIRVDHSPKDDTWIQYERGFATKKVDLSSCSEFFVEKRYIKRNGRCVDGIIEKSSVTLNVFKTSIVMNRRSNL